MPLKTTCIGAYPKPAYVPITDWFQVGHDATDYNDAVLRNWSERADIQGAMDRATAEVVADAQVRANGYIATVRREDDTTFELVASPVRFDCESEELRAAPGFAADTDTVLAELGYDEEAIIDLKIAGVAT